MSHQEHFFSRVYAYCFHFSKIPCNIRCIHCSWKKCSHFPAFYPRRVPKFQQNFQVRIIFCRIVHVDKKYPQNCPKLFSAILGSHEQPQTPAAVHFAPSCTAVAVQACSQHPPPQWPQSVQNGPQFWTCFVNHNLEWNIIRS